MYCSSGFTDGNVVSNIKCALIACGLHYIDNTCCFVFLFADLRSGIKQCY
uniref:Uncharacterized protein n=1 Tax=Anguilla anguilla TaxID=7936 RepID=A0A0E9U2M8_ANGAN